MTSEAKPVSEYEIYLGVPTLLSLQKEGGARAHRDELLFQVIHQVEELWMKLAINEINDAVGHLNADEVASALGLLRRVTEIERMMIGQLRLIEMMSPHSYIAVRKVLGQGSGQESPGFNAMLRVAPELGAAMHGVLKRACVSALEVHAEPTKTPAAVSAHRVRHRLRRALSNLPLPPHYARETHYRGRNGVAERQAHRTP
jgi:tryptophan 2,3-dioxygenase